MASIARAGTSGDRTNVHPVTGSPKHQPTTIVVVGTRTVFINGEPVACIGDQLLTPHPGSSTPPTIVASSTGTVFANGRQVAVKGDRTSCGGEIVTGSGNVNTG